MRFPDPVKGADPGRSLLPSPARDLSLISRLSGQGSHYRGKVESSFVLDEKTGQAEGVADMVVHTAFAL